MILKLPAEVLGIHSRLYSKSFPIATCSKLSLYLQTPYIPVKWIIAKYGIPCSLYFALTRHQKILMKFPEIIHMLLDRGSLIPRFLAQLCARKKDQDLYRLVLDIAIMRDPSIDIQSDDIRQFEYLTNNLDSEENINACTSLLYDHHFIPLPELSECATLRLYQLLTRYPNFVFRLIDIAHLPVNQINEHLILLVLSNEKPDMLLFRDMMKRGFSVSTNNLRSLLRQGSILGCLDTVSEYVSVKELRKCSLQVLKTFFGGNGSFSPEIVTGLVKYFAVSEETLSSLILQQMNNQTLSNSKHKLPFKTRCYTKPSPLATWTWIRLHFGAHHVLTWIAFEDLLVWIAETPLTNFLERQDREAMNDCLNVFTLDSSIYQPNHLRLIANLAAIPVRAPLACRLAFEVASKLQTYPISNDEHLEWRSVFNEILKDTPYSGYANERDDIDGNRPQTIISPNRIMQFFTPQEPFRIFSRRNDNPAIQEKHKLFLEVCFKMAREFTFSRLGFPQS